LPASAGPGPSESTKQEESSEEKESDERGESSSSGRKRNYIKGGKDGKVNNYRSKNLMAFLWTKTVNFMDATNKMSQFAVWREMKAKPGSRNEFNWLFKLKDVEEDVKEMF
jgi:hypothetical protein